jgi:hypothetical protein
VARWELRSARNAPFASHSEKLLNGPAVSINLTGYPTRIRRRSIMLDRDVKELLIGFAAIALFAVVILYLRQ